MIIKTYEDARRELLDLLDRWESGAIRSPWEIQKGAEKIEEDLLELGLIAEAPLEDGEAGLVDAALDVLTIASAQYLLPMDIPSMRELLGAKQGKEREAIESFRKYADSIDPNSREADVMAYWFGKTKQ